MIMQVADAHHGNPMVYHARRSVVEPEREWRIDDDGLSWAPGGQHWPWRDIAEIRLTFAPTRFDSRRYFCRIRSTSRAAVTIPSTHFATVATFEDRMSSYTPFVRRLVGMAAARNPQTRFLAGETTLRYLLNFAALFVGFAALIGVLLLVGLEEAWPASGDLQIIVGIKLLFIAFALPLGWAWFKRNRPRPFDPKAIPENVLPQS